MNKCAFCTIESSFTCPYCYREDEDDSFEDLYEDERSEQK